MKAEEFYKEWITVPRTTEEICKFAKAYAEQENQALQKQLEELESKVNTCHGYLMSVQMDEIAVPDALEALGFGRNGLDYG